MQDGPVELGDARVVILGAPTFGFGIRSRAPNDAFVEYVEAIDGIEDMHIAAFTVYQTRPGDSLQRLKGLVLRVGARFVAWHGYPRWDLSRGEHVLPAECMVRVR
jgi:hypothetical protein